MKTMYEEYIKDISIARSELKKALLFPDEEIICDLYAVPSHNLQSYYAMVYEKNGEMEMTYAKPQIYGPDLDGTPIKMYTFALSEKADKHNAIDGRIIMGIKKLPYDFQRNMAEIIYSLPDSFICEDGIVIDGVFQAIRVFENNEITKTALFHQSKNIPLLIDNKNVYNILDNLYQTVNDLISA